METLLLCPFVGSWIVGLLLLMLRLCCPKDDDGRFSNISEWFLGTAAKEEEIQVCSLCLPIKESNTLLRKSFFSNQIFF